MQQAPLAGEAEITCAGVEVIGAEGLQRVIHSQGFQQALIIVFTVRIGLAGQLPAAGEVIAQLTDEHRSWTLAVVTNAMANPTDVQLVSGREQGFQQQVAIVFTPGAVAGSVIAAHQIEVQRRLRTRVIAVVHAQQADHFERDGAHGHQRAEVDRAREKTLGQAPLIEPGQPRFTHNGQRQLISQPYRCTGFQPVLAQCFQLGKQVVVMLAVGEEEQLQQRLQASTPCFRSGGCRQLCVGNLKGVNQRDQRTDQRCIKPADLIVGFDAVVSRAGTHRVPQQHATQAEMPAVLLKSIRQTQTGTLLSIQPPTNARALYPAMQCWQVTLLNPEACAQGWNVQQVENLADRETAVREFEQVLDSNQQRLAAALALVSQRKGDEATIFALDLPEYCSYVRGIAVDIRDHDNHVTRAQARVFAESRQ